MNVLHRIFLWFPLGLCVANKPEFGLEDSESCGRKSLGLDISGTEVKRGTGAIIH